MEAIQSDNPVESPHRILFKGKAEIFPVETEFVKGQRSQFLGYYGVSVSFQFLIA
jgi:hypothetical protein